jgi:hypothetical protein
MRQAKRLASKRNVSSQDENYVVTFRSVLALEYPEYQPAVGCEVPDFLDQPAVPVAVVVDPVAVVASQAPASSAEWRFF